MYESAAKILDGLPQSDLIIIEALTWMAECYPPGATRECCWLLAEDLAAEHGLDLADSIGQRDSNYIGPS